MREVVSFSLKGLGLIASLWIGYNMLIFAAIASGRHVEYIPWLHFPIKVFVMILSRA